MVKTHKSTALLKKQLEMGAKGALCGTVDECEMATAAGAKKVMYAYPPANTKNIQRFKSMHKTRFAFRKKR